MNITNKYLFFVNNYLCVLFNYFFKILKTLTMESNLTKKEILLFTITRKYSLKLSLSLMKK